MLYKKIYFEGGVAKKIVKTVGSMRVEFCGKEDEKEVAQLRKLLNVPEPKIESVKLEPVKPEKPVPSFSKSVPLPPPLPKPEVKTEDKKEEKKDEKPASGDKAKEA